MIQAAPEKGRLEVNIVRSLNLIADAWRAPLARIRAIKPSASPTGGRKGDAPLPVPAHVSDARTAAATAVCGWARVLIEDRDLQHARVRDVDVVPMCALLLRHADWLAHHEAAHDIADELADAAHTLARAVTPHTRDTYRIGTCPMRETTDADPCGGEVRVRLDGWGGAEGRCRRCRIAADVTWWRDRIEVEPRVTIRQLMDALVVAEGIEVPERTVRHLVDSGRIAVVGTDERGRRLVDRQAAVDVVRDARKRLAS